MECTLLERTFPFLNVPENPASSNMGISRMCRAPPSPVELASALLWLTVKKEGSPCLGSARSGTETRGR